MPATNSDAPKDEEGTLTNIPCSAPAATVLSSSPLAPTSSTLNFTGETVMEMKAVSMASSNCSSALSSPAEASPAKPALTSSSTTFNGEVGTSPATSHIASASDSLKCTGTSLISLSEEAPSSPVLPSAVFGSPDQETNYPTLLTFKGVSVTLENNSVWKQFHGCGTEMILTKQGRRMFPYCRYRLTGLDPDQRYSLVLSIVPSDSSKYRWNTSKWEANGPAEYHNQGLIRAFSHHFSPARGSEWMASLLSFYKLKLTNNLQDQDGHIILQSMHRYIPRLHVIPVLDGVVPTPDQPVIMGPESMTFTFPQTEFMAVTTYQNFRITQLKINHNPFAKGFREYGNNPRLNRVSSTVNQPVPTTDPQLTPVKPEPGESIDAAVPLSTTKEDTVAASLSNEPKTRLVLKPIMSTNTSRDEPYVPCIRGKHALGELVLVQKRPRVEPGEESPSVTLTPKLEEVFSLTPETVSSTSTTSTPRSSPGYRKRKKRVNRHWGNSRGREWKAASASPTVVHSPSLTVAMQPELDDVEGLLFVSFTSKEALDVHVRDKPADNSSPASAASATTQMQLKQKVEMFPETDEEKITRLETALLQDLHTHKHRQVIHPVLQEVGLKLSSLDPTMPIDLQYLGVKLPLPLPVLPEQVTVDSPADGLPFISRTGKTSDMTKIKGWRNKFIRHKETSPSSCDGSQKNLSAFCSNMLDEYLESEAQNISERAAAFSSNPEGSVAYELPAKSSSYVKTLDSALKHRNAASRSPQATNRPCPLSYKPLLYSALTSSPPSLPDPPATPVQAEAQPMHEPESSHLQPGDAASGSFVSQNLPMGHSAVGQRLAVSFRQNQGWPHKLSGYTKPQMRLLQMESAAVSQGLHRTQLTNDRLSVALSVMLTKKMLPSQIMKMPHCPKTEDHRPVCGKDFCRLGCLCSALQYLHKGPNHCRRPECMFDCACDARQRAAGRKMPGLPDKKLWKNNINEVDPDPVFVPTSASTTCPAPKFVKRSHTTRPIQRYLQVQEEDKDPVYKYFESLMTCARVREFNSKPPPQVPRPGIPDTTPSNAAAKPQKTTTDDEPKMYYRTVMAAKKSGENTSDNTDGSETDVRKQIEIQSACEWDKDRKMVLEALCRRLNQDRLVQRFNIGPYSFRLVAKICMRKPSGSIITYRLLISKPSKLPESEEDEEDESDEDKHANNSTDWDMDSEEEENPEIPCMPFGVTPFLSGVLPAGRLKATTKPVGLQANGLIQVNGKFYNQARLLLGNMGSLHPANRLAAYITGRLQVPADISKRNALRADPTKKVDAPVVALKKTIEQKTSTQAAVQAPQPQPHHSQSSSTISHVPAFVFGHHSSFQSSSTASPVSLTVSPALKTPSFLGQSGTYSFRICPPTVPGIRDQSLPGVTLPGGFTLIQLPKSATDRALKSIKTEENSSSSPKHFACLGADSDATWPTITGAKDLLHSSSELMCDEKMPSDQSDETQSKQLDSNLDDPLEDLTSDSSDYFLDGDEYEKEVDIETVEDARQKTVIDKLKAALNLNESRDSSDDVASAIEQSDENCGSKVDKRRKNHTALERQRRSEQRILFDKLQSVLGANPGAPRLHILSLALKEIQILVEKSKYLEQKKNLLTRIQTVYVKELSVLSGKSDLVIKHKLKEIYNKQKMREKTIKWKPLTSYLLNPTAANQAAGSKSECSPMSLLKSHIYKTLSQDSSPTADGKTPTHHSLPTGLFSQGQIDGTFLRQQGDPRLLPKGTVSTIKTEPLAPSSKSVPQVSTVQDSTLTASLPHNSNSSVGPLTLPLMRSKTGRLILPSSLKPTGQGVYTVMLMNAKQKSKDSEVSVAPSVSNQEKSSVDAVRPSDSESHGVAQDKTVENSYLVPKHSNKSNPLVHLNLLNKSIFVPSTAPQAADYRQEADPALVSTKTSTCLSVNTVQKISPTSIKTEPGLSPPSLSPPAFRRGRGRPRKHSTTPDSESRKPAVGGNTPSNISGIDTSVVVEPNDWIPSGEDASQGSDKKPLQAKRGRGRPPKKKPLHLLHSRLKSSSSKESDDCSFRHSLSYLRVVPKPSGTPPATTSLRGGATSRPLTRGALGKDFPSAKKRSWIDVEKELEPDLDDE